MELLAGLVDEPVERRPVLALDALLQLGVLVLDRLVEDRGERLGQLLQRRQPQRPQAPAVPVAKHRAGRDRRA